MEKKSSFKKFLATASTFAVIAGASTSAMGVVKTTGGNETLGAIGTWVGGAAPVDNDSIKIDANARTLNANVADRIILSYDNGGFNPGDITINENFVMGSMGGAGNATDVVFAAVKTFTLTGTAGGAIAANIYTGLGNIDFAGNAATLIINNANGETVLTGNAANVAVAIIDAKTSVKFNATFAEAKTINITDTKTVHIDAGNNDVNINNVGGGDIVFAGNDSRLKITVNAAGGKAITVGNAWDPVGGAADDKGVLEVINSAVAGNLLTLDAGAANIGNAANHRLKEFVVGGAGETKLTNGSIFAKKISINGTGQVEFDDALDSGANSVLTFNADGDVLFSDAAAVTTIDFNGKNATVNVANGKVITSNLTTTVDNTGNLIFAAAGQAVGNIGADGAALKKVEITGAGDVDIDGKDHYAETFQFNNAASKLKVANNGILHGNATAGANGDGIIEFAQNGEFIGTIGTANNLLAVTANGAGTVKIGAGTHKVATFKAANGGSKFLFVDGANVTGAINNTSGGVNATELTFEGDTTVTGVVGAAAGFAKINLTGAKEKTVTFKHNTSATELNIGKGTAALDSTGGARTLTTEVKFTQADAEDSAGTLLIKGANNATIVSDIAKATGDRGTVKIAADVVGNVVEFKGQIGDKANANALNLLEIGANTTAQFTTNGNVHINTIKLLGDGVVELNKAGDYKIGKLENISNNGTLKISANANLIGRANAADDAINFGTSEVRLKEFVITGNRDIEIGDGINIHASKFDNAGANAGKLVFTGTSIFEMATLNTVNDKLNTITLNANANVTIASPNTIVNGATKLGNDSTLSLQGNFTGAINATNAGNGTLKFTNNNAATLTGAVGGVASLKSIEFAGNDVIFVGATTHAADKTFVFSGEGAAKKVTFDALSAVGNNVFTNDTTTTHTVILANAVNNFTKNLATDVTKQLNFQLANAMNAEISGGDATGTNFTTAADNTGELNLNKADVVINSAGADGKSLAKVTFTKNATINNNTYAARIEVLNNKTAKLGGVIKSNDFELSAADSKVIFAEGAIVNSVIKSIAVGEGLVEFAGNATITQDLGEVANTLKKVTFATGDNVSKLGAKVYATNIDLNNIKLTKDATLTGLVSAKASTINLTENTLTIAGDTTFEGNTTIKFDISDNGAALTGGKIVVEAGKALEFKAASTITLDPQASDFARPTAGKTSTFELLKNDGTLTTALVGDIKFAPTTNKFVDFTTVVGDKGGITLTSVDIAAKRLKEVLGTKADATDKANIDALTGAAEGTDGYKFVNLLAKLDGANNTEKVNEALDRLVSQTVVTDAIESVATNVGASLGARTTSLAGNQGVPVETRTVSSERVTGVSAGDEHARFGAWFSPFFSKTTQKARKGAAGYKDESYGASFGFDTRANDDLIIGAAITAANTELKHKDFKSGDKTKINSLLFSIYGMQQITDTWFALGSATFGTNEVKKSERKVSGATSYEVANAKYTSMSFTGEAMFGYNYITEQATITPMAGLRYSRVNDAGYKESGTTFQNLDVSTKASNKFEVIVGARATGGTFDLNGLTITPEIHGFINHDLINKNPKQELKLGGTALTGKSSKPVRTTYNLGLGANAEYGMMEYGASYDANLANKRVGHQGTLRLRVNF